MHGVTVPGGALLCDSGPAVRFQVIGGTLIHGTTAPGLPAITLTTRRESGRSTKPTPVSTDTSRT